MRLKVGKSIVPAFAYYGCGSSTGGVEVAVSPVGSSVESEGVEGDEGVEGSTTFTVRVAVPVLPA